MKEEIINQWIKKAENDLKVVKYLLDVESAPKDILCFHCQQAVEKYLKAYLTFVNIRVKKTHDLESVLNLCIEKDKEFEKLDKDKISKLTIYAVDIRYPEEHFEPTIEEVKEFYEMANKVRELVKRKLNENGLKR